MKLSLQECSRNLIPPSYHKEGWGHGGFCFSWFDCVIGSVICFDAHNRPITFPWSFPVFVNPQPSWCAVISFLQCASRDVGLWDPRPRPLRWKQLTASAIKTEPEPRCITAGGIKNSCALIYFRSRGQRSGSRVTEAILQRHVGCDSSPGIIYVHLLHLILLKMWTHFIQDLFILCEKMETCV